MTDPLVLSVIVLWVLVLALGLCVIALSRQIGILYERIAPMGALMIDSGPRVGDPAPVVDVSGWSGEALSLGAPSARSRLLFFVSPTCPVCKKLLPIMKSVARREAAWLDIVLSSDGERPEHAEFRQRHALEDFSYVLSQPLGLAHRIAKLPYCVLIDTQGVVRAKGLVNSREQIESLFTAFETRAASVQEHLDHVHAGASALSGTH